MTTLSNSITKPLITLTILSVLSLNSLSLKAQEKSYSVPFDACELSKIYPTVVTKVDPANALTESLLLIDCYVEYAFPSITAGPKYYTPIGQYTFDYSQMKKVAFLTNKAADYENLRTPDWMPYKVDARTGDYGDWVGVNVFGLHGAPWRYTAEFYGQKELLNSGTHGCTNLRLKTAQNMYNILETNRDQNKLVKVYNYL